MDVVEPYHPERVLRQFGRIQTIPPAPLAPARAARGATAGSYRIAYVFLDRFWERWADHVLSQESRSHPVIRPADAVFDYMRWFGRISHLAVQPPQSRSSTSSRAGGVPDDPHGRIAEAIRICSDYIQMDSPSIDGYRRIRDVLQGVTTQQYSRRRGREDHGDGDRDGD